MKMYCNTQACGFIKSEMFWYIIKDGGGEDIGKENIFGRAGGGGNLKKDGFIFPYIQSRSKPCTDDVWDTWTLKVLRNIHASNDMRSVKI